MNSTPLPKRLFELRILPPFAIGRVGSGSKPMDNFTLAGLPPPAFVINADGHVTPAPAESNPSDVASHSLDSRPIVPQPTLNVDDETGEIRSATTPASIEFKEIGEPRWEGDATHHIRPVAPFLEVWARTGDETWEPLTTALLADVGLTDADVKWRVRVANRKVARRTADDRDEVKAEVGPFSSHEPQKLLGTCPNFVPGGTIDFGRVRYIRPNAAFPGIRLRFTPACGLIYGPKLDPDEFNEIYGEFAGLNVFNPTGDQCVYDPKHGWLQFEVAGGRKPDSPDYQKLIARETLPPSLYAIVPPAPCWLHDNVAISRGYFDDTCDGTVEVELAVPGCATLQAVARICAGPPAVVPDTIFLRTLADDLDQVIFGPYVPADETKPQTRERAIELVRRAFDAVRFLNLAVMNGNPVRGRDPLAFDTMPAEEAFDVQRQMRPVVPPRTADTRAVMALHQHIYAALCSGAPPWFAAALRLPNEVGDYTDHGRRKMPAMMCGADGSYLALTWRQINAVLHAAGSPQKPERKSKPAAAPPDLVARNRSAQLHHVAAGNPVASRPITAIGNCTPGLEVDFRAVWRRVFEGVLLREWDNLVMAMEPRGDGTTLPLPTAADGTALTTLVGHRLLRVEQDNMYVQMIGPSPASTYTRSVVLATDGNSFGLGPLEWSNALARILHENTGRDVCCYFTAQPVWSRQVPWEQETNPIMLRLRVRPFFEEGTAMISRQLARPGELTQGLCSPWQNDYRECSCYYWASARPDFVNVVPTASGGSAGDNWMQKRRTGDYVPDDYVDSRLHYYDDLFREWEKHLKFQLGGCDDPRDPVDPPPKLT